MQKINFTDTTITQKPYVTINNQNYEVQDGIYTGGTDLNAQTFNTMQSNIDTAISSVDNKAGNLSNLNTAEKNNLVGAINEVNTKNIITVGLASDTTSTSTEKLNLSTVLSSIGNKLTWDSVNKGIKIGAGISKVKVSANCIQIVKAVGLYGCYIAKNGIKLENAVNVGFNYITTTEILWQTSLQPVLIDVTEGDFLYLMGYTETTSAITYRAYEGRSTNLTVEVV